MKKLISVPIFIGLIFLGAGCNKATSTDSYSADDTQKPPVNSMPVKPAVQEPEKVGPMIEMKTSLGTIKLQLFDQAAPKTVENFLKFAKENFYDGIQFHRVIPDFMIQAGDPLTKEQPKNFVIHGTGGPGYVFDDEINDFLLVRGRLAMANAGPGTNGSQFFVVTKESTPWLDGHHTVFGEVVEGMDVVDKINAVERDGRDHPLKPVTIDDITILESTK